MDEAPILLVDRDAAFRHKVEQTAEGFGLRVVVAADARHGLEIAEAAEPACAIVELDLAPGKDGLWLAAELRARPDLGGMPVVILCASDDVLIRLRALQSGIDLLLDKPIEPAVLVAQVRALVSMAGRLRDRGAISSMLRRASLDDSPSSVGPGAPFVGDIAAMPPATALTILEIDRRTGTLEMRVAGRPALVIELASGFVLGGQLGGAPLEPVDAIREALGMKRGEGPSSRKPEPPGAFLGHDAHHPASSGSPVDEAARSTEQRYLPSGPATEVTEPPIDVVDVRRSNPDLEPRSGDSPLPPRSSPRSPQRTTTLASSPAVDPNLTAKRRMSEVVKVEKKK